MRPSLILPAITCLLLHGCISPEGWEKSVWSKQELVEWYGKYGTGDPNLSFGYAGSDDKHHHFITRPIDSFLFIKVPRTELVIPDERPRSGRGDRFYFYEVDPGKDFRKISGD